ncbi:type IVB secretion system protein IcmH/DotU [Pseudomonas syringae]|uniref:Type IVB secretion system protein IcmH/DotU n=1 Tax=Pseudomonas syringae pv. papulans TaxID=83963 RepID=A0A0Q0CG83_PSESX|nr:type IVB secretion system protein IcmH/DotU [Pseudomonas syringae]KPY26187.1 Type VI secretion system protein ImpK [Pseudomonas syringae pv. papulans]KWS33565.1 type VI secretion system protein ImpK [Pseudomonas syringae pv. papulans]MDH4605622.1 type IVB secretion system protein IcmH/DotU [Pseudomonas syringae pv. papulans]MDH4620409.1 type IVB secretion system protein IcmH/DotU [Pseudomonas syringae pv. papulans]RMN44319.1 Type VI secretion system protein ImpK [Pseudomonas syringae pv. pa
MTEAVMQGAATAATEKPTLKDLVRDFITMALIVRRGRQAISVTAFESSVDTFFANLERQARSANYSVEQVKDAQYALCAFLDESVLRSGDNDMRRHFEMEPLQFRYFGVHLAGEGFFEKIELLRADVKKNLDVLEVYHLCLALGFEGKFGLGQKDQLRYLANTLGQDIARYRKTPKALSPDWALPDQVSQMLRHEVSVWLYLVLIALVCLGVYLTLDWLLGKDVAALAEQISQLFNA